MLRLKRVPGVGAPGTSVSHCYCGVIGLLCCTGDLLVSNLKTIFNGFLEREKERETSMGEQNNMDRRLLHDPTGTSPQPGRVP